MTIEAEQAQAIAERLAKIYHRVMELRADKVATRDPGAPFPTIWFGDIRPDLRSRLNSVDDAESGLEYAVWLIGETLAYTGGDAAMHAVCDLLEAMLGTHAAVWLDHRWNGVTAPGVLWAA